MNRHLLFAALAASSVVLAQTDPKAAAPTPALEDKGKAVSYREIERGVYMGANGGLWATIAPPALAGATRPFLGGQAVQVELGYDFGERVSAGIFFLGAVTNRAGSDYKGLATTVGPSGDFGMIVPGATVKVRLVGFADNQEVMRSWFYVRASGGYVMYSPVSLIPQADVLISAGPGFEYFTRLRHFSIGIEANFNFFALTSSLGFSVLPTVRYAF